MANLVYEPKGRLTDIWNDERIPSDVKAKIVEILNQEYQHIEEILAGHLRNEVHELQHLVSSLQAEFEMLSRANARLRNKNADTWLANKRQAMRILKSLKRDIIKFVEED